MSSQVFKRIESCQVKAGKDGGAMVSTVKGIVIYAHTTRVAVKKKGVSELRASGVEQKYCGHEFHPPSLRGHLA